MVSFITTATRFASIVVVIVISQQQLIALKVKAETDRSDLDPLA